MKKLPRDPERGMSLIEIMVALVIGVLVCLMAFAFYRNIMARLEKQKQVTALQEGLRTSVDCINRYLIAGGVSGDSLFFDPHKLLSAPIVNGGHRVFDMKSDSTTLSVYGNYSGGATSLAAPVINKSIRSIQVDKASIFRVGGYAYIYAGSAQEVTRIQSIGGSTLTVSDDLFTTYPKGTLIFPLERVSISLPDKKTLRVARESANGDNPFIRLFTPLGHAGDSLDFKIRSVDREAGQIAYSLSFTSKTSAPERMLLARKSDQTIFVRGF